MENFTARLPELVIQFLALMLAISVHESAHGWMADRLGDPTARMLGRITLNPIKHIDPFGTILFPLVLILVGAPPLGWAKPVPFITRNLRNPRRDAALVGLAGPASNLLMAGAVTLLLLAGRIVVPDFHRLMVTVVQAGARGAGGIAAPLLYLLFWLAMINLVLAVFNLIPIPPLDGSHLLGALLPAGAAYVYAQISRWGMLLLFLLLWTGVFGRILAPFVNALAWILLH